MTLVQLATAPGQWLRADAAASWDRVAREVQRLYGWLPVLTDSARPIEVQERIFLDRYDRQATGGGFHNDVRFWKGVRYVRRRYRKSDGAPAAAAAVPGTSRHGFGLAVDASGLGGFTGTRYRQLMSVQAKHGWSNAAGRTINEAWHQEYDPNQDQHLNTGGGGSTVAPTPAPPTSEEDDMTPEQSAKLDYIFNAIAPGESGVRSTGHVLVQLTRIENAVGAVNKAVTGVATSVKDVATAISRTPAAVWGYRNAALEKVDDAYALLRKAVRK